MTVNVKVVTANPVTLNNCVKNINDLYISPPRAHSSALCRQRCDGRRPADLGGGPVEPPSDWLLLSAGRPLLLDEIIGRVIVVGEWLLRSVYSLCLVLCSQCGSQHGSSRRNACVYMCAFRPSGCTVQVVLLCVRARVSVYLTDPYKHFNTNPRL